MILLLDPVVLRDFFFICALAPVTITKDDDGGFLHLILFPFRFSIAEINDIDPVTAVKGDSDFLGLYFSCFCNILSKWYK